jgi:hypothetical protein
MHSAQNDRSKPKYIPEKYRRDKKLCPQVFQNQKENNKNIEENCCFPFVTNGICQRKRHTKKMEENDLVNTVFTNPHFFSSMI